MCGAFLVQEHVIQSLSAFGATYSWQQGQFEFGDIYPSQQAIVIDRNFHQQFKANLYTFGYPYLYQGKKKLIINARSETIAQKPLFRHALQNHRAVVICSGFYEWDLYKQKVFFDQNAPFYLAALVIDNSFVILTQEANESVLPIHSRMPVIFNVQQAKQWLSDERNIFDLLQQNNPLLNVHQAFQQISLF